PRSKNFGGKDGGRRKKDGGRRTEDGGKKNKVSRLSCVLLLRPPSSALRPPSSVLLLDPRAKSDNLNRSPAQPPTRMIHEPAANSGVAGPRTTPPGRRTVRPRPSTRRPGGLPSRPGPVARLLPARSRQPGLPPGAAPCPAGAARQQRPRCL